MTEVRILVFFTASYPYGEGEPFVSHELPRLAEAFDEVLIFSNDTRSPQVYPLPESVTCVRASYALSRQETMLSTLGLLRREVWQELGIIRRRYGLPLTRKIVSAVLVSWHKAEKFARTLRQIAADRPDAEVHAYAYWANDMALAAAVARRNGWVHNAFCRAHRWDVYFRLPDADFLPFRHFLATHLDHYLFISRHGEEYFVSEMDGHRYPSLGCSRLGTPALSKGPLGRSRPFTLLSCSSMIPRKRVELIARSLLHVEEEVRWVHVGEGPSRGSVQAICAALPSRVEVELKGYVPHPDLLDLYAELRPSIFINLSESEGIPVSIMEAMAAGVPVIGTDVGGVGEIIADQENGVLLSSDPDPKRVAAVIDGFARLSHDEYDGWAARAWETWNQKFNASRNYADFIASILETTTPPA